MNTVRSSKEPIRDPPQLMADLLSLRDVKTTKKEIKDVPLPVDILLITARDCEFLACYMQMINPFRCYFEDVGYVYFDGEDERQQEKVSVALVRSYQGAGGPGGTLVTVKNAASLLRPKAVMCVGTCSALNPNKTKLGDVVISAKVHATTFVSRRFLNVIKNAADGYNTPLKNPEAYEIKVHCDGEFLSLQEQVISEERREELAKSCPQATAMEMGGAGIFTAAFDNQIEWLIVKGISDYADGAEGTAESWSNFASVMAASVAAHILSDPCVFRSWPNYGDEQNGLEGRVKRLKIDKKVEENQDTSTQISPEIARCDADIAFFAKKHDPDTRQWLFNDFDIWFSDPGDSRAYVLLGDAGVGKSVIAGALAQRTGEAGQLGAAYFCRHDDGTRNDPRKLLESIACQLCGCDSEYNKKVGGESSIRKMLANSELGVKELFTKLLEEPLAMCSPCKPGKLVIIDALDETEYKSREDFLDLIMKRFPSLPEWLVFFITSRPEDIMQSRLERYTPCVWICAGKSEQGSSYQRHKQDVQRFLETEIDFSHVSNPVEEIAEKCKGLFVFAHCIVEEYNNDYSGKIDQFIFPGNISDFFRTNVRRVFSKLGEDLYKKLFGCVLVAPSPLPVLFISFVLNRENSEVDVQGAIDAMTLFPVLQTSDQTVTFLHDLIPEWLTDVTTAGKFFIDKETADKYLKDVFVETLSVVVGKQPSALSSAYVDFQEYVIRFSVRFFCQLDDEDSLRRVFRLVTSCRYLMERIVSPMTALDVMDIRYLREDMELAERCLGGEVNKEMILEEISRLTGDEDFIFSPCPQILQTLNIDLENVLSTPSQDRNVSFPPNTGIRSATIVAVSSDKKTVAGAEGRSLLFANAETQETVSGPFEIGQDIIEEIITVGFALDDQFLFFGRLDKWFSVERECVEDFHQFSRNSIIYDYGVILNGGVYIFVQRNSFSYLCDTCRYQYCVLGLLVLWAVQELNCLRDDESTESTVSSETSQEERTKHLLQNFGIEPKLYQAPENSIPLDPSCMYCSGLKKLIDSENEAPLVAVRQVIVELYPQIFKDQVWNIETGRAVLEEAFSRDVAEGQLSEEWYSGRDIAVTYAVCTLMNIENFCSSLDWDNKPSNSEGDSC